MEISMERDDLSRGEVRLLLREHLEHMRSLSPPESVHALDLERLRAADIRFWSAWAQGVLLGCGALKDLGGGAGELKSMRTTAAARGRGVGQAILLHILAEAGRAGLRRLYLETGSEPAFEPARALYRKHGFVECPPFADYRPDPNSVFMTRTLE
nr:GNAT family N-acetyltransferase [Chromobacterium sp. ASV5]